MLSDDAACFSSSDRFIVFPFRRKYQPQQLRLALAAKSTPAALLMTASTAWNSARTACSACSDQEPGGIQIVCMPSLAQLSTTFSVTAGGTTVTTTSGSQPTVDKSPFPAAFYHPGTSQYAQLLGDVRLRPMRYYLQSQDARLSPPQCVQNTQPDWMREET